MTLKLSSLSAVMQEHENLIPHGFGFLPGWILAYIEGMIREDSPQNQPETFEEALAWAKRREAETGEMPKIVSNPIKGLTFDLENSTLIRAVWDEDDNLIEMTYCAVTGDVIKKNVTKPVR